MLVKGARIGGRGAEGILGDSTFEVRKNLGSYPKFSITSWVISGQQLSCQQEEVETPNCCEE